MEEKKAQARVSHLIPTTQNIPSTCPHSLISFCLLTSFPTSIIFNSLLLLLPPTLYSFFFLPWRMPINSNLVQIRCHPSHFLLCSHWVQIYKFKPGASWWQKNSSFPSGSLSYQKVNPLKLPGIIWPGRQVVLFSIWHHAAALFLRAPLVGWQTQLSMLFLALQHNLQHCFVAHRNSLLQLPPSPPPHGL